MLCVWQRGSSNALLFEEAACHHAKCLVSRSLVAWQLARSIRSTKQCLLQQACSYFSDVLCARAFQAWLVYYAQCMQQQLTANAAEEQVQKRLLSNMLWRWHVFMQQGRAVLLQNMRAAVVFRSTYLQQATFASWQGWVRLLPPLLSPALDSWDISVTA